MSSVDERIVNMKIDNKQFMSGAKASLSALTNLNRGVDKAGNSQGLTRMGSAVETVKHKFSLLNAAALTAVGTITYKMVDAGLRMVKSMTLDPIMDGFREYQTNLNSIQTIMANTGAKVNVVNKYLGQLNHYSDKTIYNFSTMAEAIGKFTSAGVNLKTSVSSIKGMANVAALSGSNVQQLNSAMYQMSQALASGTIRLQDWNSLVNAGMGGKNLQNALMTTAKSMGVNVDAMIKKYGSFRDSLTQGGWLTTKVFTQTMDAFAGDLSKKDLIAKGYTEKQAKYMMDLAKRASDAATKIKTFPQMMDVIKESIGSGWAQIFQNLFGNFNQSTKLWTKVGTSITGVISNIFKAINKMLTGWRKLGGYQDLWNGFGNIFKALGNIIRPFVDAFVSILPASKQAGSGLAAVTSGFEKVTAWIEKATRGSASLTPAVKGVADILKLVAYAVVGVVKYFAALIPLVSGLVGGIFSLIGSLSSVIDKFIQWADLGPKIQGLFDHIIESRQKVLGPILDTIGAIVAAIGTLAKGDVSGFTNQFKAALSNLAPLGDLISKAGFNITSVLESIQSKGNGVISTIAGALADAAWKVKEFGDNLKNVFGLFDGGGGGGAAQAEDATIKLTSATTDLSDGGNKLVTIMKAVGTWVAHAAAAVGKGISSIWSSIKNWASGIDKIDLVTAFSYIFDAAIFLLIRKFIKSFSGLLDGFKEIGENVAGSFGQLTDTLKTMQQGVRAKIILNIAIAVGILAGSLWVLSRIPTKQLMISLGAITTLLGEVVGVMALLGKGKLGTFAQKNLLGLAASLTLIAFAMIELATAVAMFGHMDLKTLAKGLGAVAVTLGILVGASIGLSKAQGPMLRAAASMVIMAFALEAMAGAIITYNAINFDTFASGMLKMGAALGIVVLALRAMPKSMLGSSLGIVAIAGAMVILAGALKIFAGMSVGEIAKALVVLGASMLILVASMNAMEGALPGAGALVAVSASILILANALKIMGSMDLKSIGKSLLALTAALVIFLAAGAVAEIVAGGLLALGAAIALVGAGMLAAGVGMAAFAAGLGVLVGLGVAAFGVIQAAIQVFLAMLPTIALQMAAALVSFIRAIADASPKIANAFVKMVSSMLDAANRLMPKIRHTFDVFLDQLLKSVNNNVPKFGHTFQILINTALSVLRSSIPKMLDTGMAILEGLLKGVDRRLPQIMSTATDIVVKFVAGIGNHLDKVIDAGVKVVIKLIEGIGKNGVKLANAAGKTVLDFLHGVNAAINRYEPQILAAGAQIGVSIAKGIINGLGGMVGSVVSSARNLAGSAIGAIHDAIKNPPFPSREGMALGYSLAYGFANGITSGTRATKDASGGIAQTSIDTVKKALEIHSPSRVFMGIGLNVGQGFINGLLSTLTLVRDAGAAMAKEAVDTVTKTATDAQARADAKQAQADAYRDAAALLRAKARNKKLSKAQKKQLNAQAGRLAQQAKAADKSATAQQNAINAAEKRAADAKAFNEADDQGKADILNQRAEAAAAAAQKNREDAIRLAKEADLIRAKDAKRAAQLEKQAQAALAKAASAAQSAKTNAQQAAIYATKAVVDSAAAVSDQIQNDKDAVALQAKLDAMSDAEKAAYYKEQSDKQQAESDAQYARAQALLAKANAEAKDNAVQANKDVAAAQDAVTAAEAAKAQADDYAQQAAELLGTGGVGGAGGSVDLSALTMPDMSISSSMVYGAQTMFDAYAKALAATTKAAEADKAPSISFVQNNTSPVALSPSEVYRQSKNLLSDAERKLAGALP